MSENFPMPRLYPVRHPGTCLMCALAVAGAMFHTAAPAGDVLADPTRPLTAAAAADAQRPGQIRIQAILDRGGQRIAIIDGSVVRAGDRLSWGQVEAVTATGIRYVAAGRVQFAELEVSKLQVRRPAAQGAAP